MCFLSYRKNFEGTQKRVRIIKGKRAIGVRVIEVLQFMSEGTLSYAAAHIIRQNSTLSLNQASFFCLMRFS